MPLQTTSAEAEFSFSRCSSGLLLFDGVIQPAHLLGWWFWMYRVTPFTYFVEGMLGQAFGKQMINCAPDEFASIIPPSGQTCSHYLQSYISSSGGYLQNPDAISNCQFCSARTTDELLETNFKVFYDHHWRDLGIFVGFCAINVSLSGAIHSLL